MPKIEFSAGTGLDFTPIPKGTYNLRIRKVEQKPAKAKEGGGESFPTVWIHVEVLDGQYEEKKATLFCTMKPEKGWQLRAVVQSCIPGKYEETEAGKDADGKPIFAMAFDTDDLIDTTFTADLGIEDDNKGKPRNTFNKIREHVVSGPETAKPADSKATAEAKAEADAAPSLRRRMTAS